MSQTPNFDDIRPYRLPEIKEAAKRIQQEPLFYHALKFLMPNVEKEEINRRLDTVSSALDFQVKIMHPVVWGIIDKSSGGLSDSGFENLDKDTGYLFLSNHRDIFLDSAILQILLYKHRLDTSEISFGNNLMASQLLVDVGKINKMYTVIRDGSPRELYAHSLHLSAYIRHALNEKNTSLWLAHRGGRTKDGNDQTQVSVLKMLFSSQRGSFRESFEALRIVPFTSSYEYEPCDILKAKELLISRTGTYKKKTGEDVRSIVDGVVENKGRIHKAMGTVIKDELKEIEQIKETNEKFKRLAEVIDRQIHLNYKLWPTHYIAADWSEGATRYSDHYSSEEKETFEAHIYKRMESEPDLKDDLLPILLDIYANPVRNREKITESRTVNG